MQIQSTAIFRWMAKVLALVALLTVSCGPAVSARADSLIEVEFEISADRTEVVVTIPHSQETYYFDNNAMHLCYTYKIPGTWRLTKQRGLMRTEDGRAMAGVRLYSEQELEHFEGSDLVARAARLIATIYEKGIGVPLKNVKLEPFQSRRSGTMKWSFVANVKRAGRQYELQDAKIFAEIAPGWVAQITAGTAASSPPFDDGLARQVVETLSSTSESECYWPFIRQHFPSVR